MTDISTQDIQVLYTPSLRIIRPYDHAWEVNIKPRWANGQSLLEMLREQFPYRSEQYYLDAVTQGRILLDGRPCSADQVPKHNQKMTHVVHRHEPPVLRFTPEVVHSDDDVLVISKPTSVPVHPGGRFLHNSLQHILLHEVQQYMDTSPDPSPGSMDTTSTTTTTTTATTTQDTPTHSWSGWTPQDITSLHTVHRLDVPTSGVVIFARHPAAARALGAAQTGGRTRKTYLARVQGRFPGQVGSTLVYQQALALVDRVSNRYGAAGDVDSSVTPGSKGSSKACESHFTNMGYDDVSDTTLLTCIPVTGRKHQLRAHLACLGHPIANDTHYGGRMMTPTAAAAGGDVSMWQDVPKDLNPQSCSTCLQRGYVDDQEQGCSALSIWLHALSFSVTDADDSTRITTWETRAPTWGAQVVLDLETASTS